jgi:hypothetical protein
LGRLLPWLALAALVIAGFVAFRSCKREEVVAPAMTPPAKTAAPTAAMPTSVGQWTLHRSRRAALAKLTAGFTADDLVKALNLMVVHFDTDSANISADSQDILSKAADAIKRAPPAPASRLAATPTTPATPPPTRNCRKPALPRWRSGWSNSAWVPTC